MSVSLTHAKVSSKSDGTDATQIQPSDWNAQHTLTCAGNSLIGNPTGSTGAATEIPCTAQGRSLLNAATLADLIAAGFPIFSTGDAKLTLKNTADAGWIMMNDGTIGNVSSGATFADASAQALYTLLWNNCLDAWAPVTGGRGASAAADWAAQKPIALTKQLGRALIIAGAGSGLTSRALGQILGEENHTLTNGEIPPHTHGITDPGHTHTYNGGSSAAYANGVNSALSGNPGSVTNSSTTGITVQSAGGATPPGGGAHNNMQPSTAWNIMIKL